MGEKNKLDQKNIDYIRRQNFQKCRVLGIMNLCFFELAKECLDDLAKYCDYLCIRFQIQDDPPCDFSLCNYALNHPKVLKLMSSKQKWNKWNWREDLVGMADTIMPEVILFLDDDEKFGPGFEEELYHFRQSPYLRYMHFYFEMHDKKINPWPKDHHVKVLKWQPKITYLPYPGWARTATYLGVPGASYIARTKIIHYADYVGKDNRKKFRHTGIGYD